MKRLLRIIIESRNTVATAWGLLVLRVGVGTLMAFAHGSRKLGGFAELAPRFADPYGFGSTASLALAVFAEFFCSLALIFGVFTRLATIPLIVTMLTAAFIIHGDDPFGKKELAFMYLVPFLTLLLAGAGRYSVDELLNRKLGGNTDHEEPDTPITR